MRPSDARLPELTRCTRSQVTKFIEHISDLGLGLPYIMPAIEERLGSQWAFDLEMKVFVKDVDAHNAHRRGRVLPKGDVHTIRVVEPSEEIRLSLGKLVTAIFDTACRVGVLDMVKPYLHNIVVCAHVRVTGSPLVLVLVLVLAMPTTDETPRVVPGLRCRPVPRAACPWLPLGSFPLPHTAVGAQALRDWPREGHDAWAGSSAREGSHRSIGRC